MGIINGAHKLLLATLLGLTFGIAGAQPLMINYQGRLSQISGALFPNGPAEIRLLLFDAAAGGTQVWDSGIQIVQVRDGVFSVLLQGGTPSLSSAQFIPGLRYFQISVKQGTTWTDLSPRQIVTSSPWAFIAGTVPAGAIASTHLASDHASLAKVTNGLMGVYGASNNAIGIGGSPNWKFEVLEAGPVAMGVHNTSSAVRTYLLSTNAYGQLAVTPGKDLYLGQDGSAPMVVSQAGRVGIGTPNPLYKLDVAGTLNVEEDSIFRGNVGVRRSPAYALDVNGTLRTSGDVFVGASRSIQGEGMLSLQSLWAQPLYLNPNSNGPVQIGLNSAPGLTVKGGIICEGQIDTTSSVTIGGPSVTGRSLMVYGAAGGTGIWNTWCDERVKQRIGSIKSPLETLLLLRGHSYEYRKNLGYDFPSGTRYGFIAQEVEGVLPQWVSQQGEYRALGTSEFDALSVEAIREQQSQIESLKTELARERAARSSLERRLAEIEKMLKAKR